MARPTIVTMTLRASVSEDGMRRLAEHFGGETIRIPRPSGNGPMRERLAALLDPADLDSLTASVGGDTVYVPMGGLSATRHYALMRREAVKEAAAQGMAVAAIARRERMPVRTVQRILKSVRVTRANDGQE
jgi:hypothetical protein